jgi:hypothetical protein
VANPLAAINQSRYGVPPAPRRGVTFMPPVMMAPPRAAPAAARGRVAPNASLADRIRAHPEAFDRWAEEGGGASPEGGGQGALGWIVGKAGQAGSGALTALDMGRRLAVLGTEKIATDLPDPFEALFMPAALVDEARAKADERTWKEKLKDDRYGFGQIAKQIDTDKDWFDWIANRGVGLAGDIVLDPLTYATLGVGGVAGKAGRATSLAKLLEEQVMLEKGLASGALFGAEAEQKLAQLGGREAIERIGRKGLNVANPTQAAAMGLKRPGLRFAGARVPLTGGASRVGGEVVGVGKEALARAPGMAALRGAVTRKGYLGQDLLPAYERLVTGKGPESIETAVRSIQSNEMMRKAGGVFEGLANRELRVLRDRVKDIPSSERSQMIRRAEMGLEVNPFTEYAERVRAAAREVGVELPELTPITRMVDGRVTTSQYAMPHSISRDFRAWLQSAIAGRDPRVTDFKRQAGITTDDLLEEGGFLQRRSFRPKPDGTPNEFKIGDDVLRVEEGTVDELNSKLGAMFPDFKGKIYETDPFEAWRRYINTTKRDVALRSWGREGAQRGFGGLAIDPGAPEPYDPLGGRAEIGPPRPATPSTGTIAPPRPGEVRDPLAPNVKITPGTPPQPVTRVIPNPEPVPPSEFYKYVPDVNRKGEFGELTQARNTGIVESQSALAADLADTSLSTRQEIARGIDDTAEELITPIREARSEAVEQGLQAKSAAATAIDEYQALAGHRDELLTQMEDIQRQLRNEREKMNRIQRSADRRTRQRQKQRLDDLVADADRLSERLDKMHAQLQEKLDNIGRSFEPGSPEREVIADIPRERVEQYSHELEAAHRDTRHQLQLARAAERERIGKRWAGDAKVEQARQTLRANSEKVQSRMRGEMSQAESLAKRRTIYEQQAEALEEESERLGFQLQRDLDSNMLTNPRQIAARRAEIKRVDDGAKRFREQAEKVGQQHGRAIEREAKDPVQRALETLARRQRDEEQIARVTASQREAAERAFRDLEDWKLALKDRGWVKQPDGTWRQWGDKAAAAAAGAGLDPADTKALNAAQRVLGRRDSKTYLFNRTRLRTLEDAIAKTAPAEGAARRTSAQAAAKRGFEAEAKTIRKWLADHADVVRQVDEAERTVAELEAKRADIIAKAAPTAPAEHPRYTAIEQEVAAREAEFADTEARAAAEVALRRPAMQQTAAELAEAQGTLTGRVPPAPPTIGTPPQRVSRVEQEMAGITIEEGRRGMEEAADVATRQAPLQAKREAQRAYIDEVDQAIGHVRTDYLAAIKDQEAARARHAQISRRVEGLLTPPTAWGMVTQTKKEAKSAATRLTAAKAGAIPSYEAQPMHRVIEDLNKIVRANPLGDQPEMKRIEAVLHSYEGTLADLTNDVDIPLMEVNKMLKAANKGDLKPVLVPMLNDAYEMLWDGGDVIISKELKKSYLALRRGLEDKRFGRLMTLYTNFFKTYATLSPGFHVRNALSAIFMNFTEGVTSGEQMRSLRLWREFATTDEPIEWLRRQDTEVQDAFKAVLASGSGGQFFEAGVGELSTGMTRAKEGLFANRATKRSQSFGQDWVEGPQRLALALNTTVPGGSTNDALQRITRVHFDYSQVSEFDEKAKRYIPFWTFTSRNMPLQFTQMWTRPKIYNRYASFVRNFSVPNPEFLPEYIEEGGGFNTGLTTPDWLPGAAGGMPVVMQPDLPHLRLQQDISRLAGPLTGESPGQVLSEFNPILTAPLEYMAGQDFFTGQRYGPEDVSPAGALTPIAPLLAAFGAAEHGPNGWFIDDKAMNALTATIPPLSRLDRLVPGTTGGTGDDRLAESWLRFLGAPVRTISDKQMQSEAMNRYFEQRDQARRRAAVGG